MSNNAEIEAMIQEKGADKAPRITIEDVQAEILDDLYLNPVSTMTICVLTLKNGFTVTEESACSSPENFNAEIGRKVARGNAESKIWSHLAFRLRDQLTA